MSPFSKEAYFGNSLIVSPMGDVLGRIQQAKKIVLQLVKSAMKIWQEKRLVYKSGGLNPPYLYMKKEMKSITLAI